MRKIVAEKLSEQIANWGHQGLIDNELLGVLTARYATDVTLGRILLRWLGFLAVYMLGMSLLGVLSMALGEVALYLSPVVLAVIAVFAWRKGTIMATDPVQRYPTSGAVLVTAGLIAGFAALMTAYTVFHGTRFVNVAPYMMLIISVAAFFTAYRYGLRWPLTLGVLLVFHGLGNTHRYGGHGGYFLGIQDERLTCAIAVVSILFGMWHEKSQEKDLNRREVGFGQVYIVIGLLYANLCLWFLSLPHGQLVAVLAFSAACVVQIILGGRFHDGRFIGFGIVFLSIDIYTRMFEHFWDDLSKGAFFLISGAIAMTVGVLLEQRAKKLKAEAGI